MTRRLERAFASLERMRRFRGHFYNWYDLRDLQVLEPAYVSTVDSGNLAGHLIALRQACLGDRRRAGRSTRGPGARSRPALLLAQERLRGTPRAGAEARARSLAASGAPRGGDGAGAADAPHPTPCWPRSRRARAREAALARRAGAGDGREPVPREWIAWSCARCGRSAASRGSSWLAREPESRPLARSELAARVARRGRAARPARGARRPGVRLRAWRWTSASCTTTSRKLFAIGYQAEHATRSTARTTTCSPPRRGWRASSRSPRTTCRSITGSGSAARSPAPPARRRWCRGAAACSST